MIHTALARKYRPTRFADLISQEHVSTGLAGAVSKNRVAHGYLLAGPRGTGKTTAARILAMALNCERRNRESSSGEPCGECESCKRVWSGAANLDVVEIDAASNRGVDDARELRERAMYAASGPDRYKVYIIDEAHMLTREAWNALLKILEEPPSRVVFVFATTEPQKIANTTSAVISRLQRFDFRNIGPKAIAKRLREVADAEQLSVDDDALALIAVAAKGGMRDALSILDQVVVFGDGSVSAAGVREALGLIDDETYGDVLAMVADQRSTEVFPLVARLVEQGADLVEFVNGVGETLRALMLDLLGGAPEGITEGLRQAIGSVRQDLTEGDVLRMLKLLEETETSIRRSPNPRLHVETLLLHWTMLDRTVEISEVLAAVREGGVAGSPRSARRERPRPNPTPQQGATVNGRKSGASATEDAPKRPKSVPHGPTTAPDGRKMLEDLRAHWEEVADAVGQKSVLVREALVEAQPANLSGTELSVDVTGGEVQLEGLTRNRGLVEDAVSQFVGRSLRVVFRVPVAEPAEPEDAVESRRQIAERDRETRLRSYRAQDPALDAVVEALDLELTD